MQLHTRNLAQPAELRVRFSSTCPLGQGFLCQLIASTWVKHNWIKDIFFLFCGLLHTMDKGAWWAAVHGVAQSRTWLKWLSSSSSHTMKYIPKPKMNEFYVVYMFEIFKSQSWTSLVVQFKDLPMQGLQVWSLIQENSTCLRSTKPMCHNYWALILEPMNSNYWARMLSSSCSVTRQALQWEALAQQLEKALLSATRENLCATVKTQSSQNINKWMNV